MGSVHDDASHARPDEYKSVGIMTIDEARDEVVALRSRIRSAVGAEQARFKDWRSDLESKVARLEYTEAKAVDRAKREQAKAQRMHRRAQEAESKWAMVRRAIAEAEETT